MGTVLDSLGNYIEKLESVVNTTEKSFERAEDHLNKVNTLNDMVLNRAHSMLKEALSHQLWVKHKIGDTYTMDGKPDLWKIAYYPIFEDGKTNQAYSEARALIEKPMIGGVDFREVPLRYIKKQPKIN